MKLSTCLCQKNELSKIIVDCCFKIHTTLGPGLLESVYEELLAFELRKAELSISRQQGIPVIYEGIKMDLGFRSDIIVENKVIIEIKSIEAIAPVHQKAALDLFKDHGRKIRLACKFQRGSD